MKTMDRDRKNEKREKGRDKKGRTNREWNKYRCSDIFRLGYIN
jgi:hypothetical protein